jgi:hypothetical protein
MRLRVRKIYDSQGNWSKQAGSWALRSMIILFWLERAIEALLMKA